MKNWITGNISERIRAVSNEAWVTLGPALKSTLLWGFVSKDCKVFSVLTWEINFDVVVILVTRVHRIVALIIALLVKAHIH